MSDILEISQQKFDDRARRTSLATTVAFHVGVLLLMWFWTCSLPAEPEETLTEITWGGGGGAPGFEGPEGRAMRGDPSLDPEQQATQPEQSTPTPRTPSRSQQREVNTPRTNTPSQERIPRQTEQHDQTRPTPTETPRETPSNTPDRPAETPRESEGPSGGQNPRGTGETPAAGSGGEGEGRGIGVGIGGGVGSRGWVRRPSASGDGLEASGTVSLSFTVLPDGSITNIRPTSRPHPALVNRAIQGLSSARARALPDDAPQEAQSYTINFNFFVK